MGRSKDLSLTETLLAVHQPANVPTFREYMLSEDLEKQFGAELGGAARRYWLAKKA